MGKLHELLAVEGDLASKARWSLATLSSLFANAQNYLGQTRRYTPLEEDGLRRLWQAGNSLSNPETETDDDTEETNEVKHTDNGNQQEETDNIAKNISEIKLETRYKVFKNASA